MTHSDVLNIVFTVAVVQLCLDIASHYLVYKREPYQRACSALERAHWKLTKGKLWGVVFIVSFVRRWTKVLFDSLLSGSWFGQESQEKWEATSACKGRLWQRPRSRSFEAHISIYYVVPFLCHPSANIGSWEQGKGNCCPSLHPLETSWSNLAKRFGYWVDANGIDCRLECYVRTGGVLFVHLLFERNVREILLQ